MSLNELKVGETAKIKYINDNDVKLKRRLISLGFTPDTEIKLRQLAPFGDPMLLKIRGYELALRKEDAKNVEIYK